MMAAAYDGGVNFFDNAEAYADGQSEVVMGEALKALKWPRLNYIVSTKFLPRLGAQGNQRGKPACHAQPQIPFAGDRRSLKRMGLDFVDLVYCHRPTRRHDRRNRLGDERHDRPGQGLVLGHQRMERR